MPPRFIHILIYQIFIGYICIVQGTHAQFTTYQNETLIALFHQAGPPNLFTTALHYFTDFPFVFYFFYFI